MIKIHLKIVRQFLQEIYNDIKKIVRNIYKNKDKISSFLINVCSLIICFVGVVFPIAGIVMLFITLCIKQYLDGVVYTISIVISSLLMSVILIDICFVVSLVIFSMCCCLIDDYKRIKKDVLKEIQ